ncbi:MAG: TlpA family protein disulfide reductase [Flavobacteriales bacterium]
MDTTHAGRLVAAFVVNDYISGKRELVAETRIADNGTFKLAFDITQTSEVQIVVLHMQGSMYAKPGNTYDILLPGEAQSDFKRLDKTEMQINFGLLPDDDLNNIIRSFNTDYYAFVNEHYYDFATGEAKNAPEFVSKKEVDMIGHSAKSDSLKLRSLSNFSELVTAYMDSTHQKYDRYQANDFFKQYMRYSLAEIELAAGLNRKLFYREYFMSQSVLLNNPAYMRVFKTFYHDVFTSQTKERNSQIVKYVNAQHDAAMLVELFATDSTMLSESIRKMVVIRGLKEVYYHKEFLRSAVEKTLRKMAESEAESDAGKVAANTLYSLQKNKEGWEQEDFVLLDTQNEKWQLAEHSGIPVYILFFADWSAPSLKEMLMLEKLADNYATDVLLVAINMDADYNMLKKYMYDHPNSKLTLLYGYDNIKLKENFDLKSVPHAVMLSPEQKVMQGYTQLPSQGIQLQFAKLKEQASKGGQGPKTWEKK